MGCRRRRFSISCTSCSAESMRVVMRGLLIRWSSGLGDGRVVTRRWWSALVGWWGQVSGASELAQVRVEQGGVHRGADQTAVGECGFGVVATEGGEGAVA